MKHEDIREIKYETHKDNPKYEWRKCEFCGEHTHLIFKGTRFVCDNCINKPRKKFGLF